MPDPGPAWLAVLLWVATLGAQAPLASSDREPQPSRDPLRLLSFNIRYGTADDGPDRWPLRRDAVVATIQGHRPHVLGLQEALAFQVDELAAALPGYRVLGQGRRGGREDEFCALLVDRQRLSVERHADFWLSPEPDRIASRGWDAALPRMATWAVLRDLQGGARWAVVNTHFDHRGREARAQSAALIAARAAAFAGLPVVLLGDLNAGEESPPLARLRGAGFTDSFRALHPGAAAAGTFNGFRGGSGGAKIDYVLCAGPVTVVEAWIDRDRGAHGGFPSDHYPVGAALRCVVAGR